MVRYRATLAYDGTHYHGYQRQAGGLLTVQGEIERILAEIFKEPISVWAAGRTDAGVHATGQVISFDVNWTHADDALLRAINVRLPQDIALQDIRQAPGFNPRFSALSRTYRYTIAVCPVRQPLLTQRAWQMRGPLDFERLEQAAKILIGEYDFAAFGQPPQGTNTVREIFQSGWQVSSHAVGYMLHYDVTATAFLYHQVRRMVGMMCEVGRGHITPDDFESILQSKNIARANRLAPPQGLVLVAVRYPPDASDQDVAT